MAKILDGKVVAAAVYEKLSAQVARLSRKPKLSVILVGEDPASQTYVKSKARRCEKLGFEGETISVPASIGESELLAQVDRLNKDAEVSGILVQLPLPKQVDKYKVASAIDPLKDVDGLHPENAGRLLQGKSRFVPCTPMGVIEMLRFYEIPVSGKQAVVIGRSEIVGKPMALLLLQENATVTVCHSKTKNIESICKEADILVAAMGKPRAIDASWIKRGAVVVDVGIHRVEGKLVGDVDFESVNAKASALSPVPGGVGPMTIAMLMHNVVQASLLK